MKLSRTFNERNDDFKVFIHKKSSLNLNINLIDKSIYLFIFISSFKNFFNQFLMKNDFDE
jgi:hypothetical protein